MRGRLVFLIGVEQIAFFNLFGWQFVVQGFRKQFVRVTLKSAHRGLAICLWCQRSHNDQTLADMLCHIRSVLPV